jgi:AraC-like DNA-binding protein
LLKEARQELAIKYVQGENPFTLCEIAFLLGFSEESAFSRAFKHWTGKSPSHYVVEQSLPGR